MFCYNCGKEIQEGAKFFLIAERLKMYLKVV